MAEKKTVLTKAGLEKLEEELKTRIEVTRKEIANKLKEARAQGDLSENAEFDAAKDEQALNESRIEEIQMKLKNVEIAEEAQDNKVVAIGCKVTIREEDEDEDETFVIVGSNEVDSARNLISQDSPLGAALIGAKARSTVSVKMPNGGEYKVKVKKIEISKD